MSIGTEVVDPSHSENKISFQVASYGQYGQQDGVVESWRIHSERKSSLEHF